MRITIPHILPSLWLSSKENQPFPVPHCLSCLSLNVDKMLYSNVPSAFRGYSDKHKVSQSTIASQSLLTKLAYTVKSFSFLFF